MRTVEMAMARKTKKPNAADHLQLGAFLSFNRVIELDRYGELGRCASEMVGGSSPKVIFSLHQ